MAGPSSRNGSNRGGRDGNKSGGGLGNGSGGGGGRNRGGKRGLGSNAKTSNNRSSNTAKDQRAARDAVSRNNRTSNALLDAVTPLAGLLGPMGPLAVQGYKSWANASDLSDLMGHLGSPMSTGETVNNAVRGFLPSLAARAISPAGAVLGSSFLGEAGAAIGSKAASYGAKQGLRGVISNSRGSAEPTAGREGNGMAGFTFIQDGWDSIRGKNAAQSAAGMQQRATDEGVQFQYDALAQSRADLDPFKKAGLGALNDLRGEINSMPTEADIDTGYIKDFIGGRGDLDGGVQSFLDPQAQADFLQNDPVYAAIADDTNRRLNAQAAAAGKLHSGGTAKALQDNMMLLGRERINDRMGQLTTGFNTATADRSNKLGELMNRYSLDVDKLGIDTDLRGQRVNSLMNLVTQGQNSAAMSGAASQNAGNALTNLATAQGNANAAAKVAASNNTTALLGAGIGAVAPRLLDWAFGD